MPGRDLPNTRRDYSPYEVVSALQKAIRRSQTHNAIYWACELANSGYTAWCWKRLFEIMTEDIGPAERYLPAQIKALHEINQADARSKNTPTMYLVQAVILLATAPKNGIDSFAVMEHCSDHMPRLEIPDEALDMHTRRGRQMKRSVGHFSREGALKVTLTDDEVEELLGLMEAEYQEGWTNAALDGAEPVNPWRGGKPRTTQENPPDDDDGVKIHQLSLNPTSKESTE